MSISTKANVAKIIVDNTILLGDFIDSSPGRLTTQTTLIGIPIHPGTQRFADSASEVIRKKLICVESLGGLKENIEVGSFGVRFHVLMKTVNCGDPDISFDVMTYFLGRGLSPS